MSKRRAGLVGSTTRLGSLAGAMVVLAAVGVVAAPQQPAASGGFSLSVTTRFAPSRANRVAIARPMPRRPPAPVTIAVLPERSYMFASRSGRNPRESWNYTAAWPEAFRRRGQEGRGLSPKL